MADQVPWQVLVEQRLGALERETVQLRDQLAANHDTIRQLARRLDQLARQIPAARRKATRAQLAREVLAERFDHTSTDRSA